MVGWIRVDTSIADDPAVARIAETLNVRRPEAVGLVVGVLAKMAAHAKDGALSNVPDSLLEAWAGWTRRPGRFAPAFRGELCDDAGVVRAWDRLNGGPIAEVEADAERKRKARDAERKRKALSVGQSDGRPSDRRELSPATDATDVTDEQPKAKAKDSAGARAPRPLKARESWLTPLCKVHEKIYGVGSFAPLAGRFAKSWKALVEAHGGEKCAEHWRFAHTSGTEKERTFRTPENVASRFALFDPLAPAFPELNAEQERWAREADREMQKNTDAITAPGFDEAVARWKEAHPDETAA